MPRWRLQETPCHLQLSTEAGPYLPLTEVHLQAPLYIVLHALYVARRHLLTLIADILRGSRGAWKTGVWVWLNR